jgi:hypothetical protein
MQLVSLEPDTVDGPKQVRQGQNIDPKLITVWGIYKNGDRKVVNIARGDITFNNHTPGPQTVKVRVKSREVSFQTEVMALRSLTIASPPRTVLFKQGNEPDPAWPGLEVRGEWDQMGSDKIDLKSCVITGFMKDQSGKQTIRVSFEGIAATFDVNVVSMTAIQIAQPPAKVDYAQGDPLNLTGLRVLGIWEGFPSEELSVTASDITGFNTNNVGVQRITVTKFNKSASFDIEVMSLTSILIEKPPTKTTYIAGEPLDLTGIMVTGNYTGANPLKKKSELIPADKLTIDGYDPNRIGNNQAVRVTVRGQTANFFVNVEAAPAQNTQSGSQQGDRGRSGRTTPAQQPQTIISVTVSPSGQSVAVGSPLDLTATVTGTNNTAVTWKVSSTSDGKGRVGNGTSINNNGKLTISANETAAILYVIATSVADNTKSGYVAVTVIKKN